MAAAATTGHTAADIAARSGAALTGSAVLLALALTTVLTLIVPARAARNERSAENIDVFDFTLPPDEVTALDALETGRRGGPDPQAVTLADFGRAIPEA